MWPCLLYTSIRSWGYDARQAEDFEHVLQEFASYDPQLVLLDIGLPFYNGFYWCGEIRKVSRVPVSYTHLDVYKRQPEKSANPKSTVSI